MIVPKDLKQRFDSVAHLLPTVQSKVEAAVLIFCRRSGFGFLSRTKTLESVSEKVESGRFGRWSDINDLVACAIIIPTLADEDSVIRFLQSAFETKTLRRRGTGSKDPRVFRFDSTRFIGRLRFPEGDTSVVEDLRTLEFEVQVRSAFDHAWMVATHAFTYKGQSVAWKRLRLAAQLKAAAEQLDLLILDFARSADQIREQHWPEVAASKQIEEAFRGALARAEIPTELAPKDWTRFSTNLVGLIQSSLSSSDESLLGGVKQALAVLREAIKSQDAKSFPRSISLAQYAFGVLSQADVLKPQLRRYVPLITPELLELFPKASAFEPRFDLSA